MRIGYYKGKPRKNHIYILNFKGNAILRPPKEGCQVQNKTFKRVTVYNEQTDRVSDKSVYLNKEGREYIKVKDGSSHFQYFLDEFKVDRRIKYDSI